MKVLVLGVTGQVASHLRDKLPDAVFWGRQEADFLHPEALRQAVIAACPTAVVNAAAYTAVDDAEVESELAWRINAEAPAALAQATEVLGAPLIHLSSDYVFDGHAARPYQVVDPVYPLCAYARSKLGGELAVTSNCAKYWTLRTSWVFSEYGGNFVKTMLRLAVNEVAALTVVDDQIGRPTYAGDLADVIVQLLAAQSLAATPAKHPVPYGIHHVTGGPEISWYAFAREIFDAALALGLLRKIPEVTPISTEDYGLPASRPKYSVLAPSESMASYVDAMPDWRRSLPKMLPHALPGNSV